MNIFAVDPTRTIQLRKRFVASFQKRWTRLARLISDSVVTNDCFGLHPRPPLDFDTFMEAIPAQKFRFDTDSDKVENFLAWLDEQIEKGIFEKKDGEYWFNPFILEGYSRGITWAENNVQKVEEAIVKAGKVPPAGLGMSTVRILQGERHIEALQALYTRSFQGLKGITSAMDAAISRELADGLLAGESAQKVAKRLRDRVEKIGKHRSILLARTEIVRAHHIATINRYEDLEVENVAVKAEWLGTKDDRMCERCSEKNGKIFSLEEIRPMIPLHPQCRCTTIAVFDFDEDESKRKLRKPKVKK